jgi:hypothetical protein
LRFLPFPEIVVSQRKNRSVQQAQLRFSPVAKNSNCLMHTRTSAHKMAQVTLDSQLISRRRKRDDDDDDELFLLLNSQPVVPPPPAVVDAHASTRPGNVGGLRGRRQKRGNDRVQFGDALWRHVSGLNDAAEFRRAFRCPRDMFDVLLARLQDALTPGRFARQDAVTARECICIALQALGSRSELTVVGRLAGRSHTTVGNCVDRFCQAVLDSGLRDEYVYLPDTRADMMQCVEAMATDRSLPGCWGAIDGKHWRHTRGGSAFSCYKHANGKSLTMLAIADAHYRVRWMSEFYAGPTHDSRIWRWSELPKLLGAGYLADHTVTIKGLPFRPWIVADNAFRNTSYMLKADEPKDVAQAVSVDNVLLSKVYHGARQVIEQTWGLIVNRFRMFRSTCEIGGVDWQRRLVKRVSVCIILHNMCIHFDDDDAAQLVGPHHSDDEEDDQEASDKDEVSDDEDAIDEDDVAAASQALRNSVNLHIFSRLELNTNNRVQKKKNESPFNQKNESKKKKKT